MDLTNFFQIEGSDSLQLRSKNICETVNPGLKHVVE